MEMTLGQLLAQKRNIILDKWFELILETYTEDTTMFLKQEKDRFLNPVGYTTYQGISTIYDGICQGTSTEKLIDPIYNIIRIRSVQGFSASQAVIFFFLLKKAIQVVGGNELNNHGEEFVRLNDKIDELSLQAFNCYTECREKICEIRIKEMNTQREQALRLLERLNLA